MAGMAAVAMMANGQATTAMMVTAQVATTVVMVAMGVVVAGLLVAITMMVVGMGAGRPMTIRLKLRPGLVVATMVVGAGMAKKLLVAMGAGQAVATNDQELKKDTKGIGMR